MPEVPRKRLNIKTELRTKLSSSRNPIKIENRIVRDRDDTVSSEVYTGQVFLKGQGRKQASIKRILQEEKDVFGNTTVYSAIKHALKNGGIPPTKANIARAYNRTIVDLRNARVELPKMKAIVHDGEILLISQYFGNKRDGGKLTKYWKLEELKPEEIDELMEIYARVVNSGTYPTKDLVEYKKWGGFVPLDPDQQVYYKIVYGRDKDAFYKFLSYSLPASFVIFEDEKAIKMWQSFFKHLKDKTLKRKLTQKFWQFLKDQKLRELIRRRHRDN